MKRPKTVIIGLDGAPFDKIKEWARAGRLPFLKSMIESGSFGCLHSSFLPSSPVAWTSIFTGSNPGKHGIFDWGYRENNSYDIRPVNSTTADAAFLWDILNEGGKTTGIFNVPVTYPPRPVEGFFVSGFDTPDAERCFTYPAGLSSAIRERVGDYPLSVREACLPGRERLFIDDLQRITEKKKETVLYLMKEYDLDFYAFVFMGLDHLHHKAWRFMEDDKKVRFAYEVYQAMDKTVGEIVRAFPEDTTFFIISDHGAGALEGVMYVNNWLNKLGLLKIRNNPSVFLKRVLQETDIVPAAHRILSRAGLSGLLRALPRNIQHLAATSFFSFKDVDWNATKAYSHGEYGQIYVNLKGREPAGTVEPGAEYEKLVRQIISELRKIKDPSTGGSMVTGVFRKEEIYHGPCLKNAPDILFEVKGLSYDSSVSFGFSKKNVFGRPEFSDSGTHRREGTMIVKGGNIKNAYTIEKASILDIAPTVLYSMGLEIPVDMDGSVLEGLFTEGFTGKAIPRFTKKVFSRKKAGMPYTGTDEEKVKDRLRSLGYMG